MANLNVKPKLWTPDGEVSLQEKDITVLPSHQMRQFRAFHVLAQKLNIQLRCLSCNSSFQGNNQGGEITYVVACQCREVRGPAS